MKPMPGVFIEDMGIKIGLNGVDNARLIFSNIKIKREQMLNKLNDVKPDGEFVS
jgi:acyl-CoA oxidase